MYISRARLYISRDRMYISRARLYIMRAGVYIMRQRLRVTHLVTTVIDRCVSSRFPPFTVNLILRYTRYIISSIKHD